MNKYILFVHSKTKTVVADKMGFFHKCVMCVLLYRFQNKLHNYELVSKTPLKVYWNVPSFQCNPFKLNFTTLLDKFAIRHNENDNFRGHVINILYDPGNFPAILKHENEVFLRNGGVPQEGNVTNHLNVYAQIVDQLMPDRTFSGLAIIDFESWRPIYRQNWGLLASYKNLSETIERQKHPFWPENWIKKEAARRFEEAAGKFINETLKLSRALRPNATWGYYHYPYCFKANDQSQCSKQVLEENDRLNWLFQQSKSLYPSVYLQEAQTPAERAQYIEASLEEALRIKRNLNDPDKKIFAYFWYKFQDTGKYLSKKDLFLPLVVLASHKIDGVILWGASADVNSRSNCLKLYQYIENTFGPTLNLA
ncbi:hyaluronidase B-like isoform X2 [Euwallacea fornicatus]|uniref:hyaluronidase B-like isoform X2 n=1 Tax=Euwallacea fornicatus TaxID=995702 RepID=UPI00338F932C